MQPEARFERIEAILQAMAERADRTDALFAKRMSDSERRMTRLEQRMEKHDQRMAQHDQRMEKLDQRMEKFDKQLQATRKLVEAGMKIVMRLGKSHRELERSQKAFLDSLRKGNGNGHRRS